MESASSRGADLFRAGRQQAPPGGGGRHEVEILGTPPAGVSAASVRAVVDRALRALRQPPSALSIRFASDATLRRFNQRFRDVPRTTDVLSFPLGERVGRRAYLGDVLISRDRARAQARRSGLGLRRETHELALHGLLHLLGHDHETDDGQMDRLELRLRLRVLDRQTPRAEDAR